MTNNQMSLSYTGRDTVDIRRTLVDLIPQLTDKWRDFNESDLGMTILELIAGAQDMQNFYFDTQAFETYLDTAQQDKNIRSILRAMNYRIPLTGSAKGEVVITFKEPLEQSFIIPRFTQFQTVSTTSAQKIKYFSTDDFLAKQGESQVVINVLEGDYKTKTMSREDIEGNLTPLGNISRRIYLNETNIADKSVVIDQDGEIWEECDDALLKYNGGRYFSVHKDSNDKVYLLMSVNFLDLLPIDKKEVITIKYLVSKGLAGVVEPNTIKEIYSKDINRNLIKDISNPISTYGAYEAPNLQELKIVARRQAQNMDRYITLEDYENGVATEPYIMRYVVKDWKSPHYVNVPYTVYVWAVDWSGNNLGSQDIETLKSKFRKKGVTDVSVEYQLTRFVDIPIEVVLAMKATNEASANRIKDIVTENLELMFNKDDLKYGQYISISMLQSQIMAMSPYIKEVRINSPSSDLYLDEIEFPRISEIIVRSE